MRSFEVLRVVKNSLPRAVILENVKGLVTQHPRVFNDIIARLRAMVDPQTGQKAYKVFAKLLNSCDFRLPQRRERVYIVAVKACGKPHDSIVMRWPQPLSPVGLASIIDADSVPLSDYTRYPMPTTKTGRKNVAKMLERLQGWAAARGTRAEMFPVVVDVGSSNLNFGLNVCPTLTRSRTAVRGFWSMQHGRPLRLTEVLRAQGLDPQSLKINVSENQMGAMVSNGFSFLCGGVSTRPPCRQQREVRGKPASARQSASAIAWGRDSVTHG